MIKNSFFQQLKLGVSSYSDAHRFIFRHKIWIYLLVPGILHIAIIILLIWLSFLFGDEITSWLTNLLNLGDNWVASTLHFLIAFAARIFLLLIYSIVYKYLVLIIMSPFLALLSEKTDELVTGNNYPFSVLQLAKDVIRGIKIALRNLFIEFFFTFITWILSFIPLVNLLGFAMMVFIQSYFYGFSMMDYSSERRKMNVSDSIRHIRIHKGIAVGNGLVFYTLFLVPVIGWMVAPAYAVVAATLALLKNENHT